MRASACLSFLFLLPLADVLAAEPEKEPDTVYAAAREAREKEQFDKTRILGSDAWDKPFEEIPADGAVLVGFDCGLGRRGDTDIYALRAIFRNERGDTFMREYGLFAYVRDEEGRRSRVTHTVKVTAKPGYAVGAITMRSRRQILGMSVTFMRLNGLRLDPKQSYTSDWIGSRIGGREETISGNGSPIIGVFGNRDEREVLGLGLIALSSPAAAKVPEPPRPSDDSETKPAPMVENKPADTNADSSDGVSWVPFVAFGVVAVPIFLVLWLSLGKKNGAKPPVEEQCVERPQRERDEAKDAEDDEEFSARQAERERRQRDPEYARRAALRAEYDALMHSNSSGMATTALTLGCISLLAWCIPLFGVPVSITGLVLGFKSMNGDQSGKSMIGMVLSGIGLFLSIGNAALGMHMAMKWAK